MLFNNPIFVESLLNALFPEDGWKPVYKLIEFFGAPTSFFGLLLGGVAAVITVNAVFRLLNMVISLMSRPTDVRDKSEDKTISSEPGDYLAGTRDGLFAEQAGTRVLHFMTTMFSAWVIARICAANNVGTDVCETYVLQAQRFFLFGATAFFCLFGLYLWYDRQNDRYALDNVVTPHIYEMLATVMPEPAAHITTLGLISLLERCGADDVRDKVLRTARSKNPPVDGYKYVYLILHAADSGKFLFRLSALEKENLVAVRKALALAVPCQAEEQAADDTTDATTI